MPRYGRYYHYVTIAFECRVIAKYTLKNTVMNTFTEEELEEYLIENDLYDWSSGNIDEMARNHGFSWDAEIERYIPL